MSNNENLSRKSSSEKESKDSPGEVPIEDQMTNIITQQREEARRKRNAESARRFRERKRANELNLKMSVDDNAKRIKELEKMVEELSAELEGSSGPGSSSGVKHTSKRESK